MLCLLPSVSAQKAGPVFEAFTDTRELFESSYLELTFVLRNGEGTDFSPPDFRDFRVLSGPSRGISTTILNGEVTTEMRFSYTLQPRRTGVLRIGSGSIQVGRRVLRSRSIDIAVRKGGNAQLPGGKEKEDFFVRAELSKPRAYVGEQVRLDYVLYTRVDIQSYNILEESDYLDFYVEDLQNTSDRIERKIVNGREYYMRRLRSLAVYPQKAGNFTIGPAAL
ncbi:MAG: BatD family protein, partial [Haliscomenobacter sp.]